MEKYFLGMSVGRWICWNFRWFRDKLSEGNQSAKLITIFCVKKRPSIAGHCWLNKEFYLFKNWLLNHVEALDSGIQWLFILLRPKCFLNNRVNEGKWLIDREILIVHNNDWLIKTKLFQGPYNGHYRWTLYLTFYYSE